MNLLIIEDDECCRRVLVETAYYLAEEAGIELAVDTAGTLAEALPLVERADGILCDGQFPAKPGEMPQANWLIVAGAASRPAIPFALLSGSGVMVALARGHGHAAFEKPDQVRVAFQYLFGRIESLRDRVIERLQTENPVVAEVDAANREIYDEEKKEHGKRKRGR